MDSPAAETKAERCERMLGELSELGLTLARDLHARALAAETPAEATNLALAFHRISRSLRQTLALEAKVERDRQAAARAAVLDAPEPQRRLGLAPAETAGMEDPVAHRKLRVRRALNRLVWEEAERDEDDFEILSADLANRLDEAALREDFSDIPIEALIWQIKDDMGLDGDLAITPCTAPLPPPPLAPPAGAYPVGSDAWATGCPPDPG